MALQDLTPQLRTRLSRVERAVGWFVFLAVALLVAGFVYYVFHVAKNKGWFTPKFRYQTSLNNASGLKVGDPVKLMGFPAGQITAVVPNAPDDYYGVTINFTVLKPHYGYIWDDSRVKVASDLLGNRVLEITKGKAGLPTIDEDTNRTAHAMLRWQAAKEARGEVLVATRKAYPGLETTDRLKFNWFLMDDFKRRAAADPKHFYTNLSAVYWIEPDETAALNERLEAVAAQVEAAMPNILNLTNKLAAVLDNSTVLTSNFNAVAVKLQPLLDKADSSMNTVDTNLPALFAEITATLENLANITSNLNAQVQSNPAMLSNVSKAVVDADDMVQGLKRHWLLRSAFKTNAAPKAVESSKPSALVPPKK